jgi:hypothetical protein
MRTLILFLSKAGRCFSVTLLATSVAACLAAQTTKPPKTGSSLPPTCTTSELFVLTSPPAGRNTYVCTATHTWSPQAPYSTSSGGSTTSAGGLVIQSNGTPVATGTVVNLVPGAGISTLVTDTGSQINVQQALDPAVVQTRANLQSGQSLLCASAGASGSTYTCAMSPTLTTYTVGMMVNWKPDVNVIGGPTTLNIDVLGAKPIKLSDGTTNPGASEILAGHLYLLWFDGTYFRKLF